MTMTAEPANPILVVGATGKTGRRVAERLGAQGFPCGSALAPATPPFDWEDSGDLARGARRLRLVTSATTRTSRSPAREAIALRRAGAG